MMFHWDDSVTTGTRQVRIYCIENVMKKMNQDVREADDVLYALNANAPVSMQDRRARLDPELDQYCKMLQDRRVCREQEH